jgi:hypothetical protein
VYSITVKRYCILYFWLCVCKLVTCVKSCEPGKLEQLVNGKKNIVEGFEVELDDTVLFPEGGGQVCLQSKDNVS